jgi:hypothetical protein
MRTSTYNCTLNHLYTTPPLILSALSSVTVTYACLGMKLYGSALHVYELVEPEDLASMLGHPVGKYRMINSSTVEPLYYHGMQYVFLRNSEYFMLMNEFVC